VKLRDEVILLPVAALACAFLANLVAGPERRLAWTRPPTPPAAALPTPTPVAVLPAPAHVPPDPAPVPSPSPRPAPPGPTRPTSAANRPAALPSPAPTHVSPGSPTREIDSTEAWQLHQQGARFLDARRAAEHRAGHIAGAWCAPVWEADLEARLTAFEAQSGASFGDPLVLYCGGGDCQDSHLLAGRLLALGYRNLLIYRAGYPDWVALGRPTRAGGER